MSEKKLYWIDKSSVFGGGDAAIGYGDVMPKIDEKRLNAFVKSGQVGQMPAEPVSIDAKKLIELEAENAELKKEIAELKKAEKPKAKKSKEDK